MAERNRFFRKYEEYAQLASDIQENVNRFQAICEEIEEKRTSISKMLIDINAMGVGIKADSALISKNLETIKSLQRQIELEKEEIKNNNKSTTDRIAQFEALARSVKYRSDKVDTYYNLIRKLEKEVALIRKDLFLEKEAISSSLSNLYNSLIEDEYYDCYSDQSSFDYNIELKVDYYCNTVSLAFISSKLSDYYSDELEEACWIDYRDNEWKNELNDANYSFAKRLLYDYEDDPPYFDEDENENDHDESDIVNYIKISKDLMVSLYVTEDDPGFLYLYFDTMELDDYYSDFLNFNGWTYYDHEGWWKNYNNKTNIDFATDLIRRYDLKDTLEENESEDRSAEVSIIDNIKKEAPQRIEVTSTDGNVILNNKDNIDVLKLYFRYEILDNRYWNRLEANSWYYDEDTQAWYESLNYNSYTFALNLIDEYNENPLVINDYHANDDSNVESADNNSFDENGWNLQSKLNKMGYNVNQKDNLSDYERHRILAKAIENGVYTKRSLISLLEWFIARSKGNRAMDVAVSKWKRDLEYIKKYY